MKPMKPAVVLLSGGLDSATVLAIAASRHFRCHCLSLDYGQRSRSELDAAARVAARHQAVHRVFSLDLAAFGGSALTDTGIEVPTGGVQSDVIPVTYVPARNTVMLSLALAWAEVLGACDIFFGANAVDYSGYPDCRPAFMQAFEALANLATRSGIEGARLQLHTPLLSLSKADIIRQGMALGVDYAMTVSCYQADEAGRACGACDACRLRRGGFEGAGHVDPTRYQRT